MYKDLCNQVTILESPNNGDCFFKAVSDGINIYNYENQNNKITYGNYGNQLLFTIDILREILLRYVTNLPEDNIQALIDFGETYSDIVNDNFEEAVRKSKEPIVTDQQYMDKLNYIYAMAEDNFFVYKPIIPPIDIDKRKRPFRGIKLFEINNYIRSKNCWANEIAIEAICHILKIYIASIKKYRDDEDKFKLKAFFGRSTDINGICSNKILFLLYSGNHYELIRFKYYKNMIKEKGAIKTPVVIKKWYTIFDINGLPPPLHILILIYATNYVNIPFNYRNNYGVFNDLIKAINLSVNKCIQMPTFTELFDKMFPTGNASRYKTIADKISENKDIKIIHYGNTRNS